MVAHCEDSDLIRYLEELGVDPAQPRDLSVCLVFREHTPADAASRRLQALGFTTEIDEIPAPVLLRWIVKPEWHLTGTRVSSTDLVTMTEIRQTLDNIAGEHGGAYDGWYVDIDDDSLALVESAQT